LVQDCPQFIHPIRRKRVHRKPICPHGCPSLSA
jgi:hypothetical protein